MAKTASKTDEFDPIHKAFECAGERGSKTGDRIFGYTRVSTEGQTADLQVDALLAAGVPRECIIEETGSGYTLGARPLRDALLERLEPGDSLVIWRLDRLGRSLAEIAAITEDLVRREIHLASITDGVDPSTPVGRMTLGILASTAQYERDLIAERTRAGLAATRKRGTRLGRPRALTARGMDAALLMSQSGRTVAEIADALGVSPKTIQRARRKLRDEGRLA